MEIRIVPVLYNFWFEIMCALYCVLRGQCTEKIKHIRTFA